MDKKETVAALAALAHGSRLDVFRLLVKRGVDGFTPGDLAEKLSIPNPTLSFHIKELVHAGLVIARRESRFIYYSPNFERINELIGYLTENCCSLSNGDCTTDCLPVATQSKPKQSRKRA
jgi:ArsR family transcriptional regulator, arsenate/arsenite/antimonite-responsive transcriptional repressor